MSYYAYIEILDGDEIVVRTKSDRFVKDLILEFMLAYQSYIENYGSIEVNEWFEALEKKATGDVREIVAAFYAGDWQYSLTDYKIFLEDLGENVSLTEQEFKKTINNLAQKWIYFLTYKNCLIELLRVLPEMEYISTFWFDPEKTLVGLKGILHTLEKIENEHVIAEMKIRLHFK